MAEEHIPIYDTLLEDAANSKDNQTELHDDLYNSLLNYTGDPALEWINDRTRLNAYNMNSITKYIATYVSWAVDAGIITYSSKVNSILTDLIEQSAGWIDINHLDTNSHTGEIFNDYTDNHAINSYTAVFGRGNKTSSDFQFIIGKYSDTTTASTAAFIIGNGSNDEERSNLFVIDPTLGMTLYKGDATVAEGNLQIQKGNITVSEGSLQVQKDVTVVDGNIDVQKGNVTVSQGEVQVQKDITVVEGNIEVQKGGVTVSEGDITVSKGHVSAPAAPTQDDHLVNKKHFDDYLKWKPVVDAVA